MSINRLLALPDRKTEPLKTLAHVEFQQRVLGLLCAAAVGGGTGLTTPGSLGTWSRYIRVNRAVLGCSTCEGAALAVADSIETEVAPGKSIYWLRNHSFHGMDDTDDIDPDALHGVVANNADQILGIWTHNHVTRLEPFFLEMGGDLVVLNDYSEGLATYWPRKGPAIDVTLPDVLQNLQDLEPHRGDRQLESFALEVEKDLRGFAQRDSIGLLVSPPEPILVRWELRTSSGTIPRIDRFEQRLDGARLWHSPSGPVPYPEFLKEISNWVLLKERLLEDLEEQVRFEGQVNEELFGDLRQNIHDVSTLVRSTAPEIGRKGQTIAEACARITVDASIYRGATNLVVLTGEAGSGKTHSLLQYTRSSLNTEGGRTPLVIYLSSSGKSANSLEDLLDNRVKSTLLLTKTSALALCRAGLVILVIDGFDELLGFRTYDNPLSGIKPILDELRGRGTVILSARSSYAEARLRQNLELRAAMDWPPYVMTLELLPWQNAQLLELTEGLALQTAEELLLPEVRKLLTTPFFCLAYAAWARAEDEIPFLQFVVDRYLQRERGKLRGADKTELFNTDALAAIFCEVADLAARSAVAEVSEADLASAAEQALQRELGASEKRRLGSLCGISAEWSEDERSFRFTHLAIAEHFLAMQVARLNVDQAAQLLFTAPISALCAQLIILRASDIWSLDSLVSTLQKRVDESESYEDAYSGTISLGELWAKTNSIADGDRMAHRVTLEDLELDGSGRVSLREARIENIKVGPGVELELVDSVIERLDLSRSTGAALIGDSYKQILELVLPGELAVGQSKIKRALGLEEPANDFNEADDYFRSQISLARGPIVVRARDFAPDDDSRTAWTSTYGLDAWRSFIRRMVDGEQLVLDKVNAGGPRKVRLRRTQKFDDPIGG